MIKFNNAVKVENCILSVVRMCARSIGNVFTGEISGIGYEITPTQLLLLMAINERPAICGSDIAKDLILERTTFSRCVSYLIKKGFVSIEKCSDDRKKFYKLTGFGEEALLAGVGLWKNANDHFVKKLGGKERFDSLLKDLKTISDFKN